MKFASSNFFNMDKSSKKSVVGVAKASMLFAGGNKTLNNDLNVKIVDYYSQITDLNSV
jgi:hypothetical protein